MNKSIQIGRMLRSGTTGFVVGCRVDQLQIPEFGALILAPVEENFEVFGLIHDIRVDDDGLVRQLAAAPSIQAQTIADNRQHRNVPVEISALSVGYQRQGKISHLLPPRPPLSLDLIYACSPEQVRDFTGKGRFGYFRHILRSKDLPVGELLACHIEQTGSIHSRLGDPGWETRAVEELIRLLKDDYERLMQVLSALRDAVGADWEVGDGSQ